MKRILILMLTVCLLFTAGCAEKTQEAEPAESSTPETTVPETTVPETTVPETTVPETTAPETQPLPELVGAEIQADKVPAVLLLLNRGDTADIVGEYDEEHYVIKTEQGYGLVEKQLLRLDGEESYVPWTGFAYYDAKFYSNYQLTGEPLQLLTLNTQAEVLDELEHCYVVTVDGINGFISKDGLSRYYIRYGGGGGGGSSGGQDGGDITMGFNGHIDLLSTTVPQTGDVTGQATVLADGTQVILGYFDRGDTVQVVDEEGFAPAWEGYYTIYLDGLYAYVSQGFAWKEGDEAFAQWDGYAAYGAKVYENLLLQGEDAQWLATNTVITVLWDTGDCYVVSVNGEIGYIARDSVGTSRYSTGGGGSSGSGGGGDWTPPAL